MVDPKASRFWQAAIQSGLIDAEGLQACFEAIVPEKRVAEQLDRRLARQVVQQGRLTLWQTQQILAGRSTGFKIHRYTLLELIGQGGMGRVYLARDTRLNRNVALKILSPERVNNPRAIARFQREARVGAQLQHENLVRIYDEGEANGKCYLVMEFIEGKNIGAIIAEDGPIPPATAARLAQQVALGLEHAQLKGLIHRDVNPYNILVTRDGVAKLTDLGLAIDQSEQAQVTREGATVGTFDYVSPEQARHSHSVDTRSDIYSLGCTLYHMLTGQVPFTCPSLPEKLFAHQAVEPEPVTKRVAGIPEGLSDVIQKMLRKSPDDRYPTPLDVAQALEPFTENPSGMPITGQASSPAMRASGRASMTETRVVATPRLDPLATQVATQEVPRGVVEAPMLPTLPSGSAASSVTQPSPIPIPAIPSEAAVGGLSSPPSPPSSRSNEDSGGLGLAIDLGPEPSLTEGLTQSRKKKSRSSAEIASDSLFDPVPPSIPTPPIAPPVATPREPSPSPTIATASSETETETETGTERFDGLGLSLDLGPEPSLSSGTQAGNKARDKTRARARARAATPTTKPAPARAPDTNTSTATPRARGRQVDRRWLIGAGAIGAMAVVAGIVFGFGLLDLSSSQARPKGTGDTRASNSPPGGSEASWEDGPRAGTTPTQGKAERVARKADAPEVPTGQVFAVKTRDGKVFSESNLKSAMQRAIRSKGHVLLNNREPLKLTGADASINISGGPLNIRAAVGVEPVLEVEIVGPRPASFLLTRTDTPLTIVGVSIVAHYAGDLKVVPPLIKAGGNVTLDRCAFAAKGAVGGSRAIAAEGGSLTVAGCWFEGFDTALDVAAFAGSSTTVRQSMMVQARGEPAGWAVSIRRTPGGSAKVPRRLVMEHCTARGKGLLHLAEFSSESPLQVDIQECAAMTEALLAWETAKPGTPLTAEALIWKGQANQYDIRGSSWVVLSPKGTPELPDGPTDLASWRSKMTELEPLPPPIRFRTPPESLSETPQPRDFAMSDQDARSPGADPDQVGPSAPAAR